MSSLESHIQHLEETHNVLEKKLHQAFIHYQSDEALAKLKKEKLQLRDEIETLKTQTSNDNNIV